MLVATGVVGDVRVLREATGLVQDGHRVHIIGKDVPPDASVPQGITVSGATGGPGLRRRPVPPSARRSIPTRAARWLLLPEHRNLSFRRWARETELAARRLRYDVVHAHDFTALAVGDRLARQRGVPLVYDAHEWWSERRRAGRPTPWQRRREQAQEGRLGHRAAAVLTVGQALADQFGVAYGWPHITVVRNTFPALPVVGGRPAARPVAAVYAGRLGAGRDLDTVSAASTRTSLPIRLLGPVEPGWAPHFQPGCCLIAPPVAPAEVGSVLRTAGLSLVTLDNRWRNHEIALPNKLFQAVQAGVPVIASDVGELGRTVHQYGIGELYRVGRVRSLLAALDRALTNYPELVGAVEHAADDLSWASDQRALLRVYRNLGR